MFDCKLALILTDQKSGASQGRQTTEEQNPPRLVHFTLQQARQRHLLTV
jgi:hypothetical protein